MTCSSQASDCGPQRKRPLLKPIHLRHYQTLKHSFARSASTLAVLDRCFIILAKSGCRMDPLPETRRRFQELV